jgi:hypothetical protein
MSDTPRPTFRGKLQSSLKHFLVEGARWPVDRASLAALVDIGLTNAQIAAYFAVAPDDVYMLREEYNLLQPPRD